MNITEQWNNAAKLYSQSDEQSEYSDVMRKVAAERFTNLIGKRVLDLGCGYGLYTDYFRGIGADVTGVDGSTEMIKIAKSKYSVCDFCVADITKAIPFNDGEFDIVFSNLVLMDIENIEPVFEQVHRMLKHGGTFYYSIMHPAFFDSEWQTDESGKKHAKTMEFYIKPYKLTNHFWGETTHFHRSISYYLNLGVNTGFAFKRMLEPISYDGIEKNDDLPLFMVIESIKTTD